MFCLAVATEAPRDLKKPVSLSTSYKSLHPLKNSATSLLPAVHSSALTTAIPKRYDHPTADDGGQITMHPSGQRAENGSSSAHAPGNCCLELSQSKSCRKSMPRSFCKRSINSINMHNKNCVCRGVCHSARHVVAVAVASLGTSRPCSWRSWSSICR